MEHSDGFENSIKSPAWRLRVIAGGFVLLGMVFAQRSGRIVGDTKAGLVLNPGDYLATALNIWDPNGSWGQVQNQAYGYLWPMGPFFWVGDLIGLPEWVIQRLWWFVLLLTAYLGMIVLLNALRLGRPWVHILAGFAYALSPRMLSTIGPTSIEIWPLAVAPWVVAPLVLAVTSKRDPKWMAALSALAVAMVGGVNAAATFAVIPVAAIWILTATSGRTRKTMMLWWPIFVLMGTLWWIIPLFVLGSVSPPFLDFIEGAQATHAVTTFIDALRGSSHWVTYIDSTSQAGSALIRNPLVMMNSFVVLGMGLAGLAIAPRRIRSFLWVSLLVGSFLITAGFEGNAFSETVRSLLDGVLAPLRNSHKFDPVVRIALIIGLVALIDAMPAPKGVRISPRRGVAFLAGIAVIGSTFPAWTGLLPNYGTYQAVPDYWHQAADWLNKQENDGNVFILPGAIVAEHLWGSPKDEVFESLLERPWTVRMANPLVPPANIKTIDEIERLFGLGRGSKELTQALVNQNVRYLVVRADLNTRSPSNDYFAALSTISGMENVREVKSFGPEIGLGSVYTEQNGMRVFSNFGVAEKSKAIRIFELPGTKAASSMKLSETPVIFGDPTVLFNADFARTNFAGIFAGDSNQTLPNTEMPLVITDTNKFREASFGRVIDNLSATMSIDEEYALKRRVYDFEMGGPKSIRKLIGAKSIRASSSSSQVNAAPIRTDQSPWAAFDRDPSTEWRANPAKKDKKAWIRVDFEEKIDLSGSTIKVSPRVFVKEIKVRTDMGVRTVKVSPGATTSLDLDGVSSNFLEIIGATYGLIPFAIKEITVPNATISRPLVLPRADASWGDPVAISLQAEKPKSNCFVIEGNWRCSPEDVSVGEDFLITDRVIQLESPNSYATNLSVESLASANLDGALSGSVKIDVSTRLARSPSVGPLAMIDGDNGSGWIAGLKDERPTIIVQFPDSRRVNKLDLFTDVNLPASYPVSGILVFDDGERREVDFDTWGTATFSGKETSRLQIIITDVRKRMNRLSSGEKQVLPVGVSEIKINDEPIGPDPLAATLIPCGEGPSMILNGNRFETSVVTSLIDALNGKAVKATICGDQRVQMAEGENRVTFLASNTHRVTNAVFGEIPRINTTRALLDRNATSLSVESLSPNDDLIFVAQNINKGWVAEPQAIAVNGWMQGWQTSKAEADFSLNNVYRGGILVGFALAIWLIILNFKYARSKPEARTRATWFAPMAIVPIVGLALLPFISGWAGAAIAGASFASALLSKRLGWALALISLVAISSTYVYVAFFELGAWAGSIHSIQWISSACVGALIGVAFEPGEKSLRRRKGFSIR